MESPLTKCGACNVASRKILAESLVNLASVSFLIEFGVYGYVQEISVFPHVVLGVVRAG